MTIFWKTIAGLLITAVLALQIGKKESDLATLLRMAACTMAALVVLRFIQPVLDFLHNLELIGDLHSDMLLVLLKSSSMGITAEIASSICADAGSPSLGKIIVLLSTAAILYISLPIFTALLDLVQEIAGMV